jgi:hypothetical protein
MFPYQEAGMLKIFVEEAAALASITLFVGMIAVWAGKRGCRGALKDSAWTASARGLTIEGRVGFKPAFASSS